MSYLENARQYIASVIDTLMVVDLDEVVEAVREIENATIRGSAIYIIGNGGSSSTASHMQCDIGNGVFELHGRRLNVQCLSDNTETITAIANDYSYDLIYSRQLEGRLNENDILIAISGSGNSRNIINAAIYAKNKKAKIISMTGFDGGELINYSDYKLHVPIKNMQISEDIHVIFNHLIMHLLQLSKKESQCDC